MESDQPQQTDPRHSKDVYFIRPYNLGLPGKEMLLCVSLATGLQSMAYFKEGRQISFQLHGQLIHKYLLETYYLCGTFKEKLLHPSKKLIPVFNKLITWL